MIKIMKSRTENKKILFFMILNRRGKVMLIMRKVMRSKQNITFSHELRLDNRREKKLIALQ